MRVDEMLIPLPPKQINGRHFFEYCRGEITYIVNGEVKRVVHASQQKGE
jgi:hypothetical protein